jgi:large subunit ribosomal protein L3
MNLKNHLGLLGRKVGMTRLFTETGVSIPVTVIDLSGNRVTQVKTQSKDGYTALQVSYGKKRRSRVTKPEVGHFAKANTEVGIFTREFRVSEQEIQGSSLGTTLQVEEIFTDGQKVDIQGTSIGKGFAGTIKRHNFGAQRASHGNSLSHRVPGSISMAQDPGRVFPGKKMSGHMGNKKVTTQNLTIFRVDQKRHLLLVKGAVPGAKNGLVLVRPAVKAVSKVA